MPPSWHPSFNYLQISITCASYCFDYRSNQVADRHKHSEVQVGCRCKNEVSTGAVKKGGDVKIENYNVNSGRIENPSFNNAAVAGVF